MCNASLQEGILPLSQRHVIVTPRLKKLKSDASVVKNYWPISNLSFMSKVVERLVCQQLVCFLEKHNLLPKCQLAYRYYHSIETTVLTLLLLSFFANLRWPWRYFFANLHLARTFFFNVYCLAQTFVFGTDVFWVENLSSAPIHSTE